MVSREKPPKNREEALKNCRELYLDRIGKVWCILRNGEIVERFDGEYDMSKEHPAFDRYNELKARGKYAFKEGEGDRNV